MIALAEFQSVRDFAPDYGSDLKEVEVHTARIFEAVSNMVQRAVYLKEDAVKELSDKLEQKESIIGEYQEKAKVAIEELKQAQEFIKALEQDKNELVEQLEGLRSTNENNQLLINEYKEKNDTLSGLVTKYQAYADENEQLKEQFAHDRERLQSQVKEINGQNDDQQDQIKELTREIESLKANHQIEIERLNEKKDYEKDKELLAVEREHQKKLSQINEENTAQMKKMYEELNALRKENEEVRKEYERKMEQLKQGQPKSNNRNQNKG